ncbi:sugar ABC transporter permease [Xylanimonas oleitrophica]|uniref:Sugar ABC transporter permease n=1 Tax=Xylanimonas oleitrophica TaxID=2607479 RepID=A0A2W5WK52_9MICO|nr:sugar ABC transporter permease [Xylanimonas oleitrophica]PZR51959.1 sugar ABC transporter permease [Xylanimonas oleitrophica]
MTAHTAPPRAPGTGPAAGRPAPARPARRRRRSLLPYALVAPAGVMEVLVHIVPMLLGVWIAFLGLTQLNIARWVQAPFVGLRNFATGLDPSGPIGSQLYAALGRTALFTVIVVALSWSLGMLGAVLLTSRFKGRGVLRTLFLVPYALPSYVGTIAWAFMFNQRDGVINRILVDDLGVLDHRPFWLLGGNAFWVTVVVTAWQFWPFAFLMLLAALQNIPDSVYEAAAIDGASLWRQFTRITLPMVRPANAVLLLILSLWIFNQFNVPYVLFGPASPPEATLVSPLIYQQSFNNWNFGVGGAMSVLLLCVLLLASVLYVRLVLPQGRSVDD